jgi:aminoglycoside phosphotransferase family enzyme/predicted kinase
MTEPSFYPHRPDAVELVETHISWVFLAGNRVYKVKKPVVFPFLDYGSAERRLRMCEEEVRLGRRLAPDLYLGLRAIVRTDEGHALAEAGNPDAVEHAVEQRRFDEERTLARLLERGETGTEEVREVARTLAEFHRSAEPAPAGTFGPTAVLATCDENFETLLAAAPPNQDAAIAAAHRFAVAFVHGQRRLLEERSRGGHVRDGHGDLRAEHVVLERKVEVFDPVEFDPALRQVDVAADLAFLVMDLERAGREDLASELLSGYREAGGDPGPDRLVSFYASYRAWVRAKVAHVRAGELADGDPRRTAAVREGEELAELGRRLAWRTRRPLVLVVCGPAASGKTLLANAVAQLADLPHLSSDVARKEMLGLGPTEHAPDSAYSDEMDDRTYARLGERARAAAGAGGAVVDATFRRRAHRDAFAGAYGPSGSEPVFVECRVPGAVLVERAARRARDPGSTSDATPEIAARQLAEFEPLDEVPAPRHLVLRTDRPPVDVLDDLEAALDERLSRRP